MHNDIENRGFISLVCLGCRWELMLSQALWCRDASRKGFRDGWRGRRLAKGDVAAPFNLQCPPPRIFSTVLGHTVSASLQLSSWEKRRSIIICDGAECEQTGKYHSRTSLFLFTSTMLLHLATLSLPIPAPPSGLRFHPLQL